MRILQIVHQYPPSYVGGTELYTQALARTLAGRGHDVVVFTRESRPASGWAWGDDLGVRVCKTWAGVIDPARRLAGTFHAPLVRAAFRLLLRDWLPDVVHIQHLMGMPVALVDDIRRRRVPYAVTLHDYWWFCANAQLVTNDAGRLCTGPRWYLNCARCAVARLSRPYLVCGLPLWAGVLWHRARSLHRVLRGASGVIAPSAHVRSVYEKSGLAAGSTLVVPHGVDPPDDLTADRRKRAETLRVGYIGGLSWQKGVHILVDAMAGVRGSWELWIAGDETADPEYCSRLRRASPAQVRFLGRLSHRQVWDVMSQLDALAVPSLWPETFSLVAHEGLAAGLPVIASRVGALTEVVRDGVNGLLIEPGDVVGWRRALQGFIDARWELSPKADIIPSLTQSAHVDRIEQVYRAVARGERCLGADKALCRTAG